MVLLQTSANNWCCCRSRELLLCGRWIAAVAMATETTPKGHELRWFNTYTIIHTGTYYYSRYILYMHTECLFLSALLGAIQRADCCGLSCVTARNSSFSGPAPFFLCQKGSGRVNRDDKYESPPKINHTISTNPYLWKLLYGSRKGLGRGQSWPEFVDGQGLHGPIVGRSPLWPEPEQQGNWRLDLQMRAWLRSWIV